MPELPDLPAGLTARPLRADDLPAVADLLAAAEPVDRTGENEDAEGLTEFYVNDRVDLLRDTVVVHDGDELAAWGAVVDLGDHRDEYAVTNYARVHPDRRGRGIGRALLGWALTRGEAMHRERHPEMPARLVVNVPEAMASLERLVQGAGFVPVQYYNAMRRPLADPPPVREPDGVQLVPFEWARDDEVRRVHNTAFVDHFGTAERDAYVWQTLFTGQRAFRPDLSFLALEHGAVVGYSLNYEHDADTAATGVREIFIGQLGVLPAARGRGLASALIAATLAAAADDGLERAGLVVDSENTTGALRLYEALGFVLESRETVYAHRTPALEDAAVRPAG